MTRQDRLVRTLVELAEGPTVDVDAVDYLTRLSERSVELLAVDQAGVLVADARGTLRVLAASSDVMDLLELLELQHTTGPALDCWLTGRPVVDQDLASDDAYRRWPRFCRSARALGFSVAHALPLGSHETLLGCVSLLATGPRRLPAEDLLVGRTIADVAASSIVDARAVRDVEALAERVQQAVRSRAVIEQAKGVLAERTGLGTAQAFSVLRRYSRRHRRPLSGVAAEVVAGVLAPHELTEDLPLAPPDAGSPSRLGLRLPPPAGG